MYDIKWIREHPEAFDRGLTRRGLEKLSRKLLALDEKRRAAITKSEQAQARRNSASKEIGQAKAKKDEAAALKLMAEVNELKVTLPALEVEQKKLGDELDKELAQIPNMPLDDVPDGADASGNVEHHRSGKKRDYAFKPKQHFELGEALGMMDFELAAKLSGARFVVLQKGLARMERGLGQFMLGERVFGRCDGDKFDLGELMLADHPAGILSRRARFGAEARRAGGHPQRQPVFIDDGLAHEIGERHFGGGDEPSTNLLWYAFPR